jgi:hypothetical protein
MRQKQHRRWVGVSFRVSPEVRRLVELLAARLTVTRGRRHTMTEVLAEAIGLLARREGVGG